MSSYQFIKFAHVFFVMLSISGFLLRGYWLWRESPWLRHKLSKRLPHINDTLLLVTALWMVFQSEPYLFEQDWLTAKILALLLYIALGMLALRFGKTRRQRLLAWIMAVVVFVYIVGVALYRTPMSFMVFV